MRIRDLIDRLTELADEHGDDTPVRIASQPNWPLEYNLDDNVVAVKVGDRKPGRPAGVAVYLGEGSQLGYLHGAAAVALGWSDASDEDEGDEQDAAVE